MNRQQVYDTVKAHLLAQNAKSADARDCLYRAPDGLRCAIGCLIPDELYDRSLENKVASQLPADILDHIGVDGRFLDRLQSVHDNWEPEEWPSQLPEVAAEFGLEP